MIVYRYFSKNRVLSVHDILKVSAPNWLRMTDTSYFPLNPISLCHFSHVKFVYIAYFNLTLIPFV